MSTWDVFTGRPSFPPGTLAPLAELRAALPHYDVIITSHSGQHRYEAIRRPDAPAAGPWCVVSSDPADLWHELTGCTRHGTTTSTAPPRPVTGQATPYPAIPAP